VAGAKIRDSELCQVLGAAGFKTSRGVDRASTVAKYIVATLSITSNALDHLIQTGQGVRQLAHEFSTGIIVVLPPGTTSK